MKPRCFKFSDATDERLERTTTALDRGYTDVAAIGIRVVDRLVAEVRGGSRVAFIRPDGSLCEYSGEWADLVPATA